MGLWFNNRIDGIGAVATAGRFLLTGLLAVLAAGCQTYQQQAEGMTRAWREGDTQRAVRKFGEAAKDNTNNKDHVIWRLEHATALRVDGEIGQSQAVFQDAERKIDDYESKGEILLGRETAATMSNQANLPYRGKYHDKIMLNTYRALNFMQRGDWDAARVELNRAARRQEDAIVENRKRIEQSRQEEAQSGESDKVARARKDSGFQSQLNTSYANLERYQGYGNYRNPFTVFLDGLYFLYHGAGGSDLERASKSFEMLLAFAPDNAFIRQDFQRVQERFQGKNLPPLTYVIFETGRVAALEQVRIDVPIIVANVSYVGAAFPKLKYLDDYQPALNVASGAARTATQRVASMDAIVTEEFKNELPLVISKTLIATVAKGAAAFAVNQAADQGGDAGLALLARLGTMAIQMAINIADLRSWTTLPKEFQYCVVSTPADRTLRLSTPNGGHRLDLVLGEGDFQVVCVRSMSNISPIIATHFPLK